MPYFRYRPSLSLVLGLVAAAVLAGQSPRPVLRIDREVSEPRGARQHVRVETLKFDEARVKRLAERVPERPVSAADVVAQRMLAIAEGYAQAGVSRRTDRPQISKFCRIFGLGFETGGSPTPFCASGASYSGCQAIVDTEPGYDKARRNDPDYLATVLAALHRGNFYPSPSCRMIMEKAQEEKRFIPPADIERVRPGYLVLYHWNEYPVAHHVGIVRQDFAVRSRGKIAKILTVEFNTTSFVRGSQGNGGAVAYKSRVPVPDVIGFVKTY